MGTSNKYQSYIRSKEWFAKRKKRMKIDDYECAWCGKHSCALHCHHLNYNNLFNENINTDLIILDKRCHFYADKIRKLIKKIHKQEREHSFRLDKILYLWGYPYNMKHDRRLPIRRFYNILKKWEGEK